MAPRAELPREELRRQRSSPLVRRIASEHNVDISQVPGSGMSGRVTKQDISSTIETRAAPPRSARRRRRLPRPRRRRRISAYAPGETVEVVPMSVMRKKIAEHMVLSRRTSAHVHSVFEVDFTRVAKIRDVEEGRIRARGHQAHLPLVHRQGDHRRAARDAGAQHARSTATTSSTRRTSTSASPSRSTGASSSRSSGNADERNLLGLSRAIADLAGRARAKQLKPEEVQGGTFTITNPGIFGAQFGMPIINQPQVAILGVGAIEKRAVVDRRCDRDRPRAYLTLGYDHRLIDGAVADQFMSLVKQKIETFDPASA